MPYRSCIDSELRGKTACRLVSDQFQVEVARLLSVSRMVISSLWICNSKLQVSSPGRPSKVTQELLTPLNDRYVTSNAQHLTELVAGRLIRDLAAATGTLFSRQTLYRHITEKCLYDRRPVVSASHKTSQKRASLLWIQEQNFWCQRDWSHVPFTDEARFST
ncbi:hypothetical protein AVEN_150697-1 [Araneus ventricosus]|uniref:Transposase Tc1-like domain-containing protein n=1 Tax=Araneus ventricosus TaxID=182803 RepID=A0A4Y2LTQ1_ARAVE|nr:hypothetical protein AVEN_150697-1 [Araneus ventricosus]